MRWKRRIDYRLVVVCLVIGAAAGCTELKDDLPPAVSPRSQIHPEGWTDTASAGFHGKVLKAQAYNFSACQPCHGRDYKGGTSRVSCFTCHATFPHSDVWMDFDSDLSHAKYLQAKSYNASECQACHGQHYEGGTSGTSCASCHGSFPHPATWNDTSSVMFHGKYLGALEEPNRYNPAECQQCHGTQYDGGTSGVSCKTCHVSFPHATGWMTTSLATFHGKYLKAKLYETVECESCHGTDYAGGRTGTSCITCHASFPHASGWTTTAATDFHGKYLKAKSYNATECQDCHGAQLDGGTSGVSCTTCHASYPHVTGWASEASADFHGKYLEAKTYGLSECQSCHGTDYAGGTSGLSCFTCHTSFPHPEGWTGTGASSHAAYIKNSAYDLLVCQTCHGQDYSTPKAGVSCLTCHTQTGGPEACNTCHGSSTNPAPPEDLDGNTATTFRTVGAHQAHVVAGTLSTALSCTTCHQVPAQLYQTGHVDTPRPAELIFVDTLAATRTNELGTSDYDASLPLTSPSPSYATATMQCQNTYCHGSFKNGNPTNAPVWSSVGQGEAACGTCHGDVTKATLAERALPKTSAQGGTHFNSTSCSNCHGTVVDASLNIIDKSKHINGKLNVFATERDF